MKKLDRFWFGSTIADTQAHSGIQKDALPEVEVIATILSPSLHRSRMYNLESGVRTHFVPGEHNPSISRPGNQGPRLLVRGSGRTRLQMLKLSAADGRAGLH
jgi:hypothetical protein